MPAYSLPLDTSSLVQLLCRELAGEPLIETPQSPHCKLSMVVPAYDEPAEMVLRQLETLLAQSVDLRQIEIMYIINNRPPEGTLAWHRAFDRNQRLLRLPIFRNTLVTDPGDVRCARIRKHLAVLAVDQSSSGRWVTDSNVGRAHQRGLAESVLRFAERNHNGIVLRTDVDCFFEDPQFVYKLLQPFEDPGLLAMGGYTALELDPSDPESVEQMAVIDQYLRLLRYAELARMIQQGYIQYDPEKFFGRCMAHRAFEGIIAGGVDPLAYGEDVIFGDKLKAYAKVHGLWVKPGLPGDIGPVTTMRISERTTANKRNRADQVLGGDPLVDDIFNPGQRVLLTEAYLARLAEVVRQLKGGSDFLDFMFRTSALANIRVRQL